MKSLLRKADRLTAELKARQMRRDGYCPRCGKELTAPLIAVESDDDPQICSCKPVTVIHLCGPPTQFRALDPQTGEIVSIEEMQSKCMKCEVQDDE